VFVKAANSTIVGQKRNTQENARQCRFQFLRLGKSAQNELRSVVQISFLRRMALDREKTSFRRKNEI
jgi:hypothetical protein